MFAKKLASWDAMNLDMCESLYADGTSAAPYWAYEHDIALTDADNCDANGNSISAIEFYPSTGDGLPDSFGGALFFADYSRECIWVMKKGANGLPDPSNLSMFANLGIYPVDMKVGPNGDLFFVDIAFGAIRQITYTGDENRAPTAHAVASPAYGPAPLEVGFDASGSTDPDEGDTLTYAWDLDGDGEYDDSTEEFPRTTYDEGTHNVSLRVTDSHGASHDDDLRIDSGETPPERLDRHPDRGAELARRPERELLRLGDRRAGRSAAGLGPVVEPDHQPLHHRQQLPRTPGAGLRRGVERLVRRAGPRLSRRTCCCR